MEAVTLAAGDIVSGRIPFWSGCHSLGSSFICCCWGYRVKNFEFAKENEGGRRRAIEEEEGRVEPALSALRDWAKNDVMLWYLNHFKWDNLDF